MKIGGHFCIFLRREMKKRLFDILLCFVLFPFVGNAQDWKVLFSANGGFYEGSFAVELFSTYPQGRIFYTTNGSRPTAASARYIEPLVLDENLYSESDIYTIVNSIPSQFYLADSIQHCIVIRAAVFDENDSCVSPVVTQSYFIRALGCDLHGLPVLSITADSLALFDYDTGIFVPGALYDPADSLSTGNYKMKGREWERLINMEFYEPDNSGINQECGLRTHGGASRWFQQKGMKLYAREEYGKKRFSHHFFESTPVSKFKRLCLHPFRCSNWLQTGGQEYLAQNIAKNLNIETLAVRETVVFINGEYWGIYTLEESKDEHYLEDHFEVDIDKVNIIKYWGVPHYGDPSQWLELFVWMGTADLTQPEDSAFAYTRVDVPNFIDYMLFETFSANLDWPRNNVMIWQAEIDSPFRWIFYDGDGCFTRVDYQAIKQALDQDLCSRVFQRFIENKSFQEAFRNRYYQLRDTYLSYDYMKTVLDEYGQIVEDEVAAQSQRFHFPTSVDKWYNHMASAEAFLSQRDKFFKEELADLDDVENEEFISISCYPNPFTDEIHISFEAGHPGTEEIGIYDVLGRKVFAESCRLGDGANGITLRPNLPSGLYVLKVGGLTRRIVSY